VDVKEWLGDSQYAYIPYEAPEAIRTKLRELSRELDSEELRTQAIVSIDASSRLREGRDAEFWLDTRRAHVFDPETGDNLTRDAEAGAELTRLAEQDRLEQTEDARGGGERRDHDHAVTGTGTTTTSPPPPRPAAAAAGRPHVPDGGGGRRRSPGRPPATRLVR
jgi:hypothetical protein